MSHSVELFRAVLDTNLVGPFAVAQAAARAMIARGEGGRIINIASINSFVAEEFSAGYVSSKTGLLGLTRAAAVELAPHAITVNAVAPGQIFSGIQEEAEGAAGRRQRAAVPPLPRRAARRRRRAPGHRRGRRLPRVGRRALGVRHDACRRRGVPRELTRSAIRGEHARREPEVRCGEQCAASS